MACDATRQARLCGDRLGLHHPLDILPRRFAWCERFESFSVFVWIRQQQLEAHPDLSE
jgi:hypothetical protein